MPRVVTAAVPMRMPEATIGGLASYGMVFLLTVIAARVERLLGDSCRSGRATPTSIRKRWLSVPPETMRKPSAGERRGEARACWRRSARW